MGNNVRQTVPHDLYWQRTAKHKMSRTRFFAILRGSAFIRLLPQGTICRSCCGLEDLTYPFRDATFTVTCAPVCLLPIAVQWFERMSCECWLRRAIHAEHHVVLSVRTLRNADATITEVRSDHPTLERSDRLPAAGGRLGCATRTSRGAEAVERTFVRCLIALNSTRNSRMTSSNTSSAALTRRPHVMSTVASPKTLDGL
jgi:hypothetical protein